MSSSKLTIISFYQHLKNNDDDLFKNLVIPESIDRQKLIDNILLNGADFEVLYSNPYFMQDAIGVWSTKYERTFNKWVEALAIEYSPLENYDRKEEWEDSNTNKTSGNISNISTDEAKKSAYDSNTYQPYGQTTNDSNSTSNATNDYSGKKIGRAHGNIGVTTSQQMLQSELDIAEWNLYQHITDLFIDEFLIQIYV